jgi:hypothetical protein
VELGQVSWNGELERGGSSCTFTIYITRDLFWSFVHGNSEQNVASKNKNLKLMQPISCIKETAAL